jgi:hypothetical protein
MNSFKKLTTGAAIVAAVFVVSACGGGGGDGGGAAAPGGGSSTSVSGTSAKGIVINGIVTLKDGEGNVLDTTPAQVLTGMNGSFTADVGDYTGPVFVEITAGANTTIQDEITGNNVSASNVMGVILESVTTATAGQPATANVSPFTTIVAQLAKNSAGNGTPVSALLVQQAQAAIATTLGFNPVATAPVNPRDADATAAASPEARKQALLLAALAQFGTENPTCVALEARADELACAARQYAMAYQGSTIMGGNASIAVDGSTLAGFSQAVSTVSADPVINTTGTTIDPATDPSTSTLAMAEDNPDTPQLQMVAVPEEGFNADDIAAVKALFNNLRSNAAALDNAELNGPIETQLADFADSINTQTFGLDFGTLEILDGAAQAGELFIAYATSPEPRPTTSLVGGPGIVGTTACQVFAGVPATDENGVVRSVPEQASSTGQRNGQSVGCTIFGPAVPVAGGGFSQIRHYTLHTLAQGTTGTLVVNSDSRLCTFPQGYNPATDADTCLQNGQIFGGVGGTGTTARLSEAVNGDISVFFEGEVAPPLTFAITETGPTAALLADSVSVSIDFTANDSSENGFFRGDGSITSTLDGTMLTASFTDIDVSGTEDEQGNLMGNVQVTGTVESNFGLLTGTFTANNTAVNMGTINFSGSLAVGSSSQRTQLFTGNLVLTEMLGNQTTPSVDTATFSGTVTLPQRPDLLLNLQLSETFGTDGSDDAESLLFTYQQNGTTVMFSGSADNTGAQMVTFSSPTSMVTVGPFNPETAMVVDVLRDGRKAGEYQVQNARINYTDGSFEQF